MRRATAALLLLAAATPTPLLAQAYQCAMPRIAQAPPDATRPADEPRRVRPVTGYTLALSWSPEHCRTRKQSRQDALQCGGENGEFGFILHGLWPETDGSDYPQWCAMDPPDIAPGTVQQNLCIIPSERLIAHEWAKHGTCMARKPESYFAISARLYRAVRYPDMERLSRSELTAGMLAKAFADANPGLEPEMVAIDLNRRGWLQQVRLCLGEDFRPRTCPAFARRPRGDTSVKIWRGL